MSEKKLQWLAVYTKPRWEKKVASGLTERGIENYCPLTKALRQWSDRKKIIFDPVFKGYVFVKIAEEKKWDVKRIDGVLNYVHHCGKPAQIKEEEIDIIRKFLHEFNDVYVEKRQLSIESKVRIKQGVLMNYEGLVVEVFGNRAVVKIDSLDLQLSALFERKNLEPVL